MIKNFKCSKCGTTQTVGKRLHASWTCPNCKRAYVLSKTDVNAGHFTKTTTMFNQENRLSTGKVVYSSRPRYNKQYSKFNKGDYYVTNKENDQ